MVSKYYLFWYRLDEYENYRALLSDRDSLPPDYDDWLRAAEATEREKRAEGYEITRVEVTAKYFGEWCYKYGVRPDSAGRDRFLEFEMWEPPRRGRIASRLAGWTGGPPQPPSPGGPRIIQRGDI